MKITDARVIVCSPGRNFVTLKIETDEGIHGLGDATLNGRELAVASYLTDHVVPVLIGRDPARIEDTWQYLYRGAYWRRGPVTMSAIAAVDTALWDIKGKVAGLPLYELLGGAQPRRRHGVRTRQRQRHRRDRSTRSRATSTWATRRFARNAAFPGWRPPMASAKDKLYYEPADAAIPTENVWSTSKYLDHVPKLFDALRARFGFEPHLLHDVHHRLTPIEAGAAGPRARALPAVLDGGPDAGREPGRRSG